MSSIRNEGTVYNIPCCGYWLCQFHLNWQL